MKKVLSMVVVVILAMTLLVACASAPAPATDASEGDAGANTASDSGLKFALVLHSINGSFYAKISEGAVAAGKDLGVTVDVMGPSTPNSLQEQVNMIESCIGAGYDGIATVVWDPEGFNNVIQKAHDAGIPVVGLNQDSPDSGRDAFVGQDLEASGYMLGKYMFENVMNGEGKYIIASCGPAETALVLRANGILRANEEYPNIEMLEIVDISTDLTKAVGVIENAYLAHPDATAVLGVDAFSEAIGTFIAANKLQDKLKAGGFDLTEGTLKHIKNGDMQVTLGQNPFLQGYYPMVGLFLQKTQGYAPVDISTGVMLVNADNIDSVQPE